MSPLLILYGTVIFLLLFILFFLFPGGLDDNIELLEKDDRSLGTRDLDLLHHSSSWK